MSGMFIEAKDAPRQKFPGMGTLGMLSRPTDNDRVVFGELVLTSGDGFNFHYHPHQDEAIYVVAGSMEAWVGQEQRTLGPGDTMWIPKGTVHACFNTSHKPVKLFVMLTPVVKSEELGFELVDISDDPPWNGLR